MFWGSILNHSSFVNRGHMSWIFRFLDFFCRQMWFLDFLCEIFTPRTHAYTRTRMRTHARTHAQTHTHTCHTNTHMRTHTTNTHSCERRDTTSYFAFWVSCCASVAPPICTEKTGPLPQYGNFPKYWQNVSWIFPHHGKHSLTMELDKTIESGFCNLFL